jgi:hypothetical protein
MLSKCPILDCDPLCLRATGAGISEIDLVSPDRAGALDLFVSQNEIEHLRNVTQFRSLQRLMIAYNRISRIEDLFPLIELQNLKELNLEGNPVCRLPLFDMHVFYMLPKLQILNGRKRQAFFKKHKSMTNAAQFVEAEASLLKWLATADLVLNVLSMNPRPVIRTLATYFSDRYPLATYAQYCHDIRSQAENVRAERWLKFLTDLLTEKQRQISESAGKVDLDQVEIRRRSEILAGLPERNDFDPDLASFRQLNDSLAKLIEVKRSNASKMSDIFSMVGSRSMLGSRSVYSRHHKKTDSRDTQSLLEGREARERLKELSSDLQSPVKTEPEPTSLAQGLPEGEPDPEPEPETVVEPELLIEEENQALVVEIPLLYPVRVIENSSRVSRAFSIWKAKAPTCACDVLTRSRAAEAESDSFMLLVLMESSTLSLEEHRRRIRESSERHDLLRRIDFMQDVNELARGRYVQIQSEMEVVRDYSVGSRIATSIGPNGWL